MPRTGLSSGMGIATSYHRNMSKAASTVVSRVLSVPPEAVYGAFLDPDAVATWLPPGSMRGIVHAFEGREGGPFSMTLVYPDDDATASGKTTASTDTFRGRFAQLIPNERVVWAVEFEAADPSFAGEMIVRTTLAPEGSGTKVTIECDNIPPGIRPADNEDGCRLTLAKLADFLNG